MTVGQLVVWELAGNPQYGPSETFGTALLRHDLAWVELWASR
jgi:hypothetical protein